jgi:hypothetical protein
LKGVLKGVGRLYLEMKMKKLLATTAVALVAMASTASAQSVLERVLSQIDNATNLAAVNGTFANIAENIGASSVATVYQVGTNAPISESDYLSGLQDVIDAAAAANPVRDEPNPNDYDLTNTAAQSAYNNAVSNYNNDVSNRTNAISTASTTYENVYTSTLIEVAGVDGINGSITNVIDGITDSTQTAIAGSVSAVEYNMPTLNFGDMATTALGAVNTGDITLGVNSSVDNAKTSSTEAVSSVMAQLGGSADTGAIVLNIASNMTGVNGSITNTMTEVNGTVGALSTTALGAVNTGTIISGVNAAVTGITGASSGQSGL